MSFNVLRFISERRRIGQCEGQQRKPGSKWGRCNSMATANTCIELDATGVSDIAQSTIPPEMDGHDNRSVAWSRGLVFFVLCAAASTLAGLTYHFISTEQQKDMLNDFVDLGDELIDISQENVKKVFGVLKGFSVEATSFALHEGSEWPFVTLPYFQARAEAALSASDAKKIAFVPLVAENKREKWETYSIENQGWIQEAYVANNKHDQELPDPMIGQIYSYGESNQRERLPVEANSGPFAPVWQVAPPPTPNSTHACINYDLLNTTVFKNAVEFVKYVKRPVFLDFHTKFPAWFGHNSQPKTLTTAVLQPVYSDLDKETSMVVAFLVAVLPWTTVFENVLHDGAPEVTVVMKNTCNGIFSFSVYGQKAKFLGEDDLHDPKYTHLGMSASFADFASPKEQLLAELGEHCVYTIHVYPTACVEDKHINGDPQRYALIVMAIFVSTSLIFTLYDCLVQRRQMNLLRKTASMHYNLVSSLFPSSVRDRVIDAVSGSQFSPPSTSDKPSDYNNYETVKVFGSHPIADLFPEATIMFCDIAGFTAWSSMRGPEQVFTLLETVYHSFDVIAAQKGVFKVETIGDSYVAVCGLPDYRKDHAVVMAEFARKCLSNFNRAAQRLETILGPETMDLKMRFGLHSGPVTAGVLRGQKARFQLFGDTVNTASRVESTGSADKIQLSSETADLLRAAGKEDWLERRQDLVYAKGKGAMETYWLTTQVNDRNEQPEITGSNNVTDTTDAEATQGDVDSALSTSSSYTQSSQSRKAAHEEAEKESDKQQKLIKWNCALLMPHLRKIVSRRKKRRQIPKSTYQMRSFEDQIVANSNVAEEVVEIIELPEFSSSEISSSSNNWRQGGNLLDAADSGSDELDDIVAAQLESYVTKLSSMYNENAFHNFAHASHVVMSTGKLLARIVAPGSSHDSVANSRDKDERRLHDHTYGITSDPLTQFSVMLAALIHDVDHCGVPNSVLGKENKELGEKYGFKSIAEQNSVDLAWNALMSREFEALRRCIYCNGSELKRFRQLIVNSVMATDIFDKDLSLLRTRRWDKAFSPQLLSSTIHSNGPQEGGNTPTSTDANSNSNVNRKATIVIEHLIQASDVAHTMQHWHIYQKWNTRLFEETYGAFLDGRTATGHCAPAKDPSVSWYNGEIWFFDHYVIPLAKKLKDCGVFGVSSDEYLNYAIANRREWLAKGNEIVQQMKHDCDLKKIMEMSKMDF